MNTIEQGDQFESSHLLEITLWTKYSLIFSTFDFYNCYKNIY